MLDKLAVVLCMYTGENYVEVKREDDSSDIISCDIDMFPDNEPTGTSMFYLSLLLIIVYFIIRLPNICLFGHLTLSLRHLAHPSPMFKKIKSAKFGLNFPPNSSLAAFVLNCKLSDV